MNTKLKKFRFTGVAVVVAVILTFAWEGGENKNTEETTVTITEAYTVNQNQGFSAVDESTTKKADKNKKSETDKTVNTDSSVKKGASAKTKRAKGMSLSDIPKYDGEPYVVINNNEPSFNKSEITDKSFEKYAALDSLGRCGTVMACIGKDIMPTEKRGSIGQVKPTGWHTVKYDFVDGKYLYNRCHLIGYQLTGENANERNLITGTRYMNVDGMLPFEEMVADYIKETNNHVMYRVIPIYKGNNLLVRGVEMEAYSVEDKGEGISFHIYCYNIQPGVKINYANGASELINNLESETKTTKKVSNKDTNITSLTEYVLNLKSHKFHYPSCYSVAQMSEENKGTFTGDRQDLIEQGYDPCGNCNP